MSSQSTVWSIHTCKPCILDLNNTRILHLWARGIISTFTSDLYIHNACFLYWHNQDLKSRFGNRKLTLREQQTGKEPIRWSLTQSLVPMKRWQILVDSRSRKRSGLDPSLDEMSETICRIQMPKGWTMESTSKHGSLAYRHSWMTCFHSFLWKRAHLRMWKRKININKFLCDFINKQNKCRFSRLNNAKLNIISHSDRKKRITCSDAQTLSVLSWGSSWSHQ